MIQGALRIAREVGLQNASTIEFLVRGDSHWFIEANARLQVEHTITEEVTGVDLVQAQLRLAAGESLADLGLEGEPQVRGFAVQARVNLETISSDGSVRPTGGVLRIFEPATGPGVRTDTYASSGYETNPSFDSLLAKVIGHAPSDDVSDAIDRTVRALRELRVAGVETNAAFLEAVLAHPDVRAGLATTDFVDRNVAELVATAGTAEPEVAADGRRGRCCCRLERSARGARARQVVDHSPRAECGARRRRECGRRADPRNRRDREHRRGGRGARRPAPARHGSDEDGARHRVDDERHRARSHRGGR